MIDEKKLIEELENLKEKTIIMPSDIVFNNAIKVAIDTVNDQQKVNEWTPVEKAMPKEKQRNGEVLNSDVVLVTLYDYIEDIYYVDFDYTINGQWSIELLTGNNKVIAWMPPPKPY